MLFIINKYQTAVDYFWLTDSTDCWSYAAFCCNNFFFVTAVVYSRYWDFYMADVNVFLLVN